jgi:CheY-like chemotaxis protein
VRLLLIVEDDLDTRLTLVALLSEIGYSVCDAGDGRRALQELRSLHPDLVLLDYGLPAPTGGADFLRAKALDPAIASIPVIVVSAYNLPNVDGAVAVMRKPFELDELLAAIAHVVGPPEKPNTTAAAYVAAERSSLVVQCGRGESCVPVRC